MNDPKRIIVVLLGLILIGMATLGIKGHMDSDGYKTQVNYTTAIQSTQKDDFNYIVDSQQGRVLANGNFSTKDAKQARFPEMNKGYTYVDRVKEHYTMHTYTTCSKNSCTTHVYYSWDQVGSDDVYANYISFMGRKYPATLFNFSKYDSATDCSNFSAAGTSGFFKGDKGCVDGDIYLTSDDRYVYSTVPLTFNATFLATTYGGLKPFNESSITLQNKSIQNVLKDVGKYQLISFWVVTVLLVLLTIAAIYGAYTWVMEDGVWSTKD